MDTVGLWQIGISHFTDAGTAVREQRGLILLLDFRLFLCLHLDIHKYVYDGFVMSEFFFLLLCKIGRLTFQHQQNIDQISPYVKWSSGYRDTHSVCVLAAVALVRLTALNRLCSDLKGYFVRQYKHLSPLSPLLWLTDLQLHQRDIYSMCLRVHLRLSKSHCKGPFFLSLLRHNNRNYLPLEPPPHSYTKAHWSCHEHPPK